MKPIILLSVSCVTFYRLGRLLRGIEWPRKFRKPKVMYSEIPPQNGVSVALPVFAVFGTGNLTNSFSCAACPRPIFKLVALKKGIYCCGYLASEDSLQIYGSADL